MALDIIERLRRYLRAIGPAIAGSGTSHEAPAAKAGKARGRRDGAK